MKVRYQWSEDGDVELCEREIVATGEAASCYHCGFAIRANEDAVKLTAPDGDVYLLHPLCADKSCIE